MNSKNKLLIIIASILVVAAVVLVVVITKMKGDDGGEPVTAGNVTEQPAITEAANATTPTDKPNENDDGKEPAVTDPLLDNPTGIESQDEDKFTLGEYKGLKVSYSPKTITDSDIDNNLKLLQEENSTVIDLPDRPFEEGDLAIVTYIGRLDGFEVEGLYMDCLQVVLGSNMIPAAMEEKVIGARIGDTFDVDVTYSSDFTDLPAVAGKTVTFSVELVDGFTSFIPEIDDELIRNNTEYSSLNEYRTKEKERLQELENENAEAAVVESLKRKVVDNCTFPSSVDTQVKKTYVLQLEEENNDYLENFWMDADTYYQYVYGYEPGQYAKELMDSINYNVKYNYALDEISKVEGIEVTEAEFDEYFNKTYIEGYGYASQEHAFTMNGEQQVRDDVNTAIKRSKASQLIYDSAEIS